MQAGDCAECRGVECDLLRGDSWQAYRARLCSHGLMDEGQRFWPRTDSPLSHDQLIANQCRQGSHPPCLHGHFHPTISPFPLPSPPLSLLLPVHYAGTSKRASTGLPSFSDSTFTAFWQTTWVSEKPSNRRPSLRQTPLSDSPSPARRAALQTSPPPLLSALPRWSRTGLTRWVTCSSEWKHALSARCDKEKSHVCAGVEVVNVPPQASGLLSPSEWSK